MTVEVRLENLERKLAETNAELNRVRCRNLWLLGGGILIAGLLALPWMFKDARRSYQLDGKVRSWPSWKWPGYLRCKSAKMVLASKPGFK
jgi:hypothetical protein